jgi:hypothetical protein
MKKIAPLIKGIFCQILDHQTYKKKKRLKMKKNGLQKFSLLSIAH